jgi:hypothetical protein
MAGSTSFKPLFVTQEAIEKYNTHIERCNRAIEAAEQGGAISTSGAEIE